MLSKIHDTGSIYIHGSQPSIANYVKLHLVQKFNTTMAGLVPAHCRTSIVRIQSNLSLYVGTFPIVLIESSDPSANQFA